MKTQLLQHIPITNRITREELANKTGVSDRLNRKEIEELRNSGIKIHSSSHDVGYKLVTTEQEDKELLMSYFSRLKSEYDTLVAMYGKDKINDMVFDMINQTSYTG